MIELHYNYNKYFNLIANYTDTTATLSVCKKIQINTLQY